MAAIWLRRSSFFARADWVCVSALFTSAPALSRAWRKASSASSCWAFITFTRARPAPALKIGCNSVAAAESRSLPGLTIMAPALLVQPAVPLSVMDG